MTWEPPAGPPPQPPAAADPYGAYGSSSTSPGRVNPYENFSGSANPYADASGRPVPQQFHPQQFPQPAGAMAPPGPPAGGRRGLRVALIAAVGVIVVIVAAVTAGKVFAPDYTTGSGYVADSALQPGMCLESLTYGYGNGLPQVPCARVHQFEVLDSTKAKGRFGFPGMDSLQDQARVFCDPLVAKVRDTFDVEVTSSTLFPTEDSWAGGDRLLTCMIAPPAGRSLIGAQASGDLRVAG